MEPLVGGEVKAKALDPDRRVISRDEGVPVLSAEDVQNHWARGASRRGEPSERLKITAEVLEAIRLVRVADARVEEQIHGGHGREQPQDAERQTCAPPTRSTARDIFHHPVSVVGGAA